MCGRQFDYEILHGVLPLGHRELRHALHELVRGELIFVRGTPPDATYTFKHALLQDSAYGSLHAEQRRALHARVAAVLIAQRPEFSAERPEVLAQHHAEAGDDDAAVNWWKQAGERALRRGAVSEAATLLRRGLQSLARLPEGPERAGRELPLQLDLCVALAVRHGHSAPETSAA